MTTTTSRPATRLNRPERTAFLAPMLTLLTVLLCCTGMARATDSTNDQTKHALDLVMVKWIDAEIHHDAKALGALLAEPFVATFDDNAPVPRAAYLSGLTKGPADPTAKQEVRDENVIIDGDTAVLVLMNTMHGTSKGTHYDLALRATVTFVRRNGQWQALALHGSLLKPAS